MNCIVICLDTWRWDALGCVNPGWVQTPGIDRFAAAATRFNSAYCGSFPTVPMRVDAYTGDVNWPRYGWKGLDENQVALPTRLREHGVYTGLVLDTANNVGAGLHRFYDEWTLIKKDIDDGVNPGDIVVPVPEHHFRQNAGGYRRDRANWSHYRHEEDWFVSRTMRAACRWLEDNAGRDAWFLWVDTFEIHEDWMAPKYYTDLYAPDYAGPAYTYPNYGYTDIYTHEALQHLRDAYAAEVTLTDRWVGHLLRQVEVMGLYGNTCVILTSDHGMYIGEHNRAGKHTVDATDPWPIYDTVGRVPLLVHTPFPDAPATVDVLCQSADIMPTVLELCGVADPAAPVGKSWAPLLRGEGGPGHDRIYTTCHSGGGPGGIRYLGSHITVTTPTHSAVFGPPSHRTELYDRARDPEQIHDIAAAEPALVETLRGELRVFMERQGAPAEYVAAYTGAE
ncbi:MAG: sulfatase [Lentisphaeria bacterium]|nr:sulfatase [Lentisphaeria bacterium]